MTKRRSKSVDCPQCGQDIRLPPLTLEEYEALVEKAGEHDERAD